MLPGGFGGLFDRANSELTEAAPLLGQERYRLCGSSSVPVTGNRDMPITSAGPDDYESLMRSGRDAFKSSNWQQALNDFQRASEKIKEGVSWIWVGNTYLAMGRSAEASTAWDEVLKLKHTVPFHVCSTKGISTCQDGSLDVGPKTVTFFVAGQKIFDVPASQVTVTGTADHHNQGFVSFGLEIDGKKYNFNFFPFGAQFQGQVHVNTTRKGMAQQKAVGDYISQTIPKLASGALVPPSQD